VKTINLLCAGNKVFVKYQAQGGVVNPLKKLAYVLGEWIASLSLHDTKTVNLALVQCVCHIRK